MGFFAHVLKFFISLFLNTTVMFYVDGMKLNTFDSYSKKHNNQNKIDFGLGILRKS